MYSLRYILWIVVFFFRALQAINHMALKCYMYFQMDGRFTYYTLHNYYRIFLQLLPNSIILYISIVPYNTSLLALIPLGISGIFLSYLSIICVYLLHIGVLAHLRRLIQVNSTYPFFHCMQKQSHYTFCQENKKATSSQIFSILSFSTSI